MTGCVLGFLRQTRFHHQALAQVSAVWRESQTLLQTLVEIVIDGLIGRMAKLIDQLWIGREVALTQTNRPVLEGWPFMIHALTGRPVIALRVCKSLTIMQKFRVLGEVSGRIKTRTGDVVLIQGIMD